MSEERKSDKAPWIAAGASIFATIFAAFSAWTATQTQKKVADQANQISLLAQRLNTEIMPFRAELLQALSRIRQELEQACDQEKPTDQTLENLRLAVADLTSLLERPPNGLPQNVVEDLESYRRHAADCYPTLRHSDCSKEERKKLFEASRGYRMIAFESFEKFIDSLRKTTTS